MPVRKNRLRTLAVCMMAVACWLVCSTEPADAEEPQAQGEPMFQIKRLSNPEVFPGKELAGLLSASNASADEKLDSISEDILQQMAENAVRTSCVEKAPPGGAAYPLSWHCNVWEWETPYENPVVPGWCSKSKIFKTREDALAYFKAHPVGPDGKPLLKDLASGSPIDLQEVENRRAFVALYLNSGKLAYINPNGQTNALFLSEAYDSTLSLPFTKFIFGNLKIDLMSLERISRKLRSISARITQSASDRDNAEALDRQVSATTEKAQKGLEDVAKALSSFMTAFPFFLLFVIFFLQILSLVVGKAGGFKEAQGVSPVKLMFRLFAFAVGILLWRPAVMWLVDFFNLMSLSIATYEEQTSIVATIAQNLELTAMTGGDSGYSGSTIGSIILTVCSWVVQGALFLMLIARDIMLGLSCVLGPVSLALGYYKNMTGSGNALGEYITGWCGNFIKLLLWGILTAIMIVSLGLYSAVSTMIGGDTVTMAITACAFVYAAANIPKYAENMSTLAMQSLLMAVPAAAGTYGWNTTRGGLTIVGGWGVNLFKRGVARFFDSKTSGESGGQDTQDDGPKYHY